VRQDGTDQVVEVVVAGVAGVAVVAAPLHGEAAEAPQVIQHNHLEAPALVVLLALDLHQALLKSLLGQK